MSALCRKARWMVVGALAASMATVMGACAGGERTGDVLSGPRASQRLDRDAYARLGYRLVWTGYASISPGERVREFEVLGDAITVLDSSGVVTVLSPVSGELKWAEPLGSPLTKFVGIVRDGTNLAVCSESEAYYLAADSGTLLAKQSFDRVVNTKPVNTGALLVMGTSGGEVLGHLNTGFKAWAYGVGGAFESDPVMIGGDYVGLVSQNGRVIIVQPATGSAASQYRIAGGVACDPAASDSMMFVASVDQSIYGFDIFGAQPKWRKRTDSRLSSTPTYRDGKLYVQVPSAGLLCLDAQTGADVWAAAGVRGTVIGRTAAGWLLVWDGKDAVTLDPKSGDVIARATLPGLKALVPDRFDAGHLYAVTTDGAVHKFEPR